MYRIAAALLSLLVAITLASTVALTDAANGEKLARRWCADCHVVASDQRQGSTCRAVFRHRQNTGHRCRQNCAVPVVAASEDAGHEPVAQRSADLAAYIEKQGK